MREKRKPSPLLSLRARGFDASYRIEGNQYKSTSYRVKCSQCEALVINGIAAHETGCPNGRRASSSEDE